MQFHVATGWLMVPVQVHVSYAYQQGARLSTCRFHATESNI